MLRGGVVMPLVKGDPRQQNQRVDVTSTIAEDLLADRFRLAEPAVGVGVLCLLEEFLWGRGHWPDGS